MTEKLEKLPSRDDVAVKRRAAVARFEAGVQRMRFDSQGILPSRGERIEAGKSPERGGILAALRRSPLVGAELDLGRDPEEDRSIEL